MSEKYKVLIMRCDKYDPEKIYSIVKKGMQELGCMADRQYSLKTERCYCASRSISQCIYTFGVP